MASFEGEALPPSPSKDAFVPIAAGVSSDVIDAVIQICKIVESLKDEEARNRVAGAGTTTIVPSQSADSSVKCADDSLDSDVIQKAIEVVCDGTEQVVGTIEATKSVESIKTKTE